jgi:hypothetical protein
MEDEAGQTAEMTTDQLVRVVRVARPAPRLVVLNTCDSANQAQPIVQFVEAAIGMTQGIGDDAARAFASQLYSSIGEGQPLGIAFEQARLQVSLAGIPEDQTPALFTREGIDPNTILLLDR